jgi:hypothetical protein
LFHLVDDLFVLKAPKVASEQTKSVSIVVPISIFEGFKGHSMLLGSIAHEAKRPVFLFLYLLASIFAQIALDLDAVAETVHSHSAITAAKNGVVIF